MLDRLDFAPGWKSAVLGLVGTLSPFLRDLLPYLGLDPVPEPLLRSGQAVLVALIGVAIALKARRGVVR